MRKTMLKFTVFLLTFLIALVLIGRIMNRGNYNRTTVMAPATLPVITMEKDGIAYNELHGYVRPMETAYQRETITELGEGRELVFAIDTYGNAIQSIDIEVRSCDGSRLIENSPVRNISLSEGRITADIALKDLLEKDTEYTLVILLRMGAEEPVRYYTRVIWSENTHMAEKLSFVEEFHETLFSRDLALEKKLTMYLEPDSTGDNTTFHRVNIHSSFFQATWGDLNVTQVEGPRIRATELASQTGSFLVDFMVSTGQGEDTVYYMAEEFYRVRRVAGAERLYLLDYERTMTQIPDVRGDICANDKIMLGIVDENLDFKESPDGNVVVFEVAGRLFSYNLSTNRMAVLFGFYDEENRDARALYPHYKIKILDVDEGGGVHFAVYGYMNRGNHEGEVGIQVCYYDSSLNMVEEKVYLPYDKSASVLEQEMERLLYMNRGGKLYLFLGNTIYRVDVLERDFEELVKVTQDGSLMVSDNHRVVVWQEGDDLYHGRKLVALNLDDGTRKELKAGKGEAIMPLGIIGEDVIYGLARQEDLQEDRAGRVFFPMYKVCICDSQGTLLKTSQKEGYYVLNCSITENQISLEQLYRDENGVYQEVDPEYIMSNTDASTTRNQLVVAAIDVYEKYVQIQTKSNIDAEKLQILTPREEVYEDNRELVLESGDEVGQYFVYGSHGISGIYWSPARAVIQAYEESGAVVDDSGRRIWIRGNRVTRNQIMAIKAQSVTEDRSSLAVCLDTILEFEGITRNTQALLDDGSDAMEILRDNLRNVGVLDLSGCSLDAVLHYVNQDIPVMAVLENGEAVLVVGFNQYNVVLMDPVEGRLYQKGINDSTKWFEENGNCFITYIRQE